MDFRHPSEIKWSNNIIKDSIRRDFTINAIYYKLIENIDINYKNKQIQTIKPSKNKTSEEKILQILNKEKNFILISKI
jgi:uncharacterized protein YktA (UPF0223 family)